MSKLTYVTTLVWALAALQLLCAATAGAAGGPAACEGPTPTGSFAEMIVKPEPRYPQGQESMLGEGWVRLGHKISPTGSVEGIWLIDIVGAPIFAHAAAGALTKARFRPALVEGKPVEANGGWEVTYRIEGKNRAGVHAKVGNDYDSAKAARDSGDFRRSIEILNVTQNYVLNLYEYTLVSYGLAVSYRGLNDRRRTLAHIRHAAIGDAGFADRGQRRSVLELLAEFAIRDNSHREGLCAYALAKQKFPDAAPTPQLQELVAAAERDLAGTGPIRSEVELIESGRADVQSMWLHAPLRQTLRVEAAQGLKSIRVLCPTSTVEETAPFSRAIALGAFATDCTLYAFGDPGAKFVLIEQ